MKITAEERLEMSGGAVYMDIMRKQIYGTTNAQCEATPETALCVLQKSTNNGMKS